LVSTHKICLPFMRDLVLCSGLGLISSAGCFCTATTSATEEYSYAHLGDEGGPIWKTQLPTKDLKGVVRLGLWLCRPLSVGAIICGLLVVKLPPISLGVQRWSDA
jgi:hypothetical protein